MSNRRITSVRCATLCPSASSDPDPGPGRAPAPRPQTRVTGVWSRRPKHAAQLATQLGVSSYLELDELFATCDAVAIAVAPAAQPELAVRAAQAGKVLLLQNPLARHLA